MKYNIFTVANETYSPFLVLLLSSIFDKVDLSNVEAIKVADTGLSEETKKSILKFPKVKIVDTGEKTRCIRLHDEGWKKNTYSKSSYLLSSILSDLDETGRFFPTIMIDVDCVVVSGDFFEILDKKTDLIVCRRNSAGRSAGHQATSSHIGSFFVANTEKSIDFIKRWIQEIPKITEIGPDGKRIPQESPALSKTFEIFYKKMSISEIDERVIANIEHNPPKFAKIYHLKSDWQYLTVEKRIEQARNLYYKQRYLL